MRARALLLSLLLLNLGAVASADRALARSPRGMRTADAAAPMRTFYMKGTLLSPSGTPSLLAGLAKLSVGSTGAYSGTLTMAGVAATSVVVTGTMTLIAQLGGQSITLAARSVAAPVGDRGKSSPATTSGMDFQGAVTAGGMTAGYVTAIDTSVMREYSFAASIKQGSHPGSAINGGLYLLSDRSGDLQGYVQDDATGAIYPLLSGTLARGQLLVHLDLLGGGNLVGMASTSRSILNNQLVYTGTFYGPTRSDSGTWLSSPPES